MIYFFPPSSLSNYETTVSLDGTDYIFLFHWNERTGHWYYRISLTDGTTVMGDKKLTNEVIVNRDVNENTPPGELKAFTPQNIDNPGLFDLSTNVVFLYAEEEDLI